METRFYRRFSELSTFYSENVENQENDVLKTRKHVNNRVPIVEITP